MTLTFYLYREYEHLVLKKLIPQKVNVLSSYLFCKVLNIYNIISDERVLKPTRILSSSKNTNQQYLVNSKNFRDVIKPESSENMNFALNKTRKTCK